MLQVRNRLPAPDEYLVLDTGYTSAREYVARRDGSFFKTIYFPATCVLLHHPTEGYCLFDTGYAPRFHEVTRRFPERIYALATPVVCSAEQSAVVQLESMGLPAQEVRHIFVSHFHGDHVAGLCDFPAATIWCSREAWSYVSDLQGFGAVRHGVLRQLEPDDMPSRLRFYEDARPTQRDDALGQHFDVFDDGYFRMIALPGHARGQYGMLLQGEQIFLVADAFWRSEALREGILPAPTVRLFFDDWRAYVATFYRLREWWAARPEVRVLACHDIPSMYS